MASCFCVFNVFGIVLLAIFALPVYYLWFPPLVSEVKGKCAVVTGASYGVGVYIAESLAREGVSKIIITARNKPRLDAAAADLSKKFPKTEVLAVVSNVGVAENNTALVKKTQETFGSCPVILVHNVAIKGILNFESTTKQKLDSLIDINFRALVHLTHDFMPLLIKNKGHIVNIGSQGAKFPAPFFTTYSATKAAMLSFSSGLRAEMRWKRTGVSVHCVMPGFVKIHGEADSERVAGGRGSLDDLFNFAGFSEPEQTADAVVDAIKYDHPELVINNPPAVRYSSIILQMFPRFGDIAFDNAEGKLYLRSVAKLADAVEKLTSF